MLCSQLPGRINEEVTSDQYFFNLVIIPQRLLEATDGTSISLNRQLPTCRVKMKEEM